jgi:hypothetical protein
MSDLRISSDTDIIPAPSCANVYVNVAVHETRRHTSA